MSANELAFIKKRVVDVQRQDDRRYGEEVENQPVLQCSTRTDLVHAFVAMFYNTPFMSFKRDFEIHLRLLQTVQHAFFPFLLNFVPLFLYQDTDFLSEYFAR